MIEVEGKAALADIENLEEVRGEIVAALEGIRDVPNREEQPLIYHLDVAAMYPNIILTNRRASCCCAGCPAGGSSPWSNPCKWLP